MLHEHRGKAGRLAYIDAVHVIRKVVAVSPDVVDLGDALVHSQLASKVRTMLISETVAMTRTKKATHAMNQRESNRQKNSCSSPVYRVTGCRVTGLKYQSTSS